MGPSRSRTLSLIVFLFLAALSLRPWPRFDDAIELALEPARALASLCTPLSWLSAGEVRAAEIALLANDESRRAAGRAVLLSAQTGATPKEGVLARDRGLVHAEVFDREEEDPDRVLVRFAPGSAVLAGMPVVCGDFYVGRVASLDRASPGVASVDLVTGEEFRVAAAIAPTFTPADAQARPRPPSETPLAVVGGLVPRGRPVEGGSRDLLLAVHCPSDRQVSAGLVRVRELDPGAAQGDEPFAGLADGFLLGTLERVERGRASLIAVRPGLDYAAGLYQVAIVCPSHHAPAGPNLARDPFEDAAWIDVPLALAGDPTFWRESRIVRAGADRGLRDGAALALGATFLGCVTRVGHSTSKASLLGDAGVELFALARPVAPRTEVPTVAADLAIPPFSVGRLVSLGRERSSGDLLLRWEAAIPIQASTAAEVAPDALQVVLYTAAGQRAVPPGLRIGETELPRGRGPFVLRVRQEEDGRGLTRVRAWREPGLLSEGERGGGRP